MSYREIEASDAAKQANVNLAGDRRRSNSRDNHARHSFHRSANLGPKATKVNIFALNFSNNSLSSFIDESVPRRNRERKVSSWDEEYDDQVAVRRRDEGVYGGEKGYVEERGHRGESGGRSHRRHQGERDYQDERRRRDRGDHRIGGSYEDDREHRFERRQRRRHHSIAAHRTNKSYRDDVFVDEEDLSDYRHEEQGRGTRNQQRQGNSGVVLSLIVSFISIFALLRPKRSQQRRSRTRSE